LNKLTESSPEESALVDDDKQRLLIFIVAYNAEKTIIDVLKRIPHSLLDDYETEVLIIDDHSQDQTFERGRMVKDAQQVPFKMTVLFNPINQGYGGNQKIGYQYAIRENFDFVALLHGDGQYAPEKLPDLIAPLAQREAAAVFGTRMSTRFGALRGGMPLYKFVGNRILSTFQNLILGIKLSEFHSGYRCYAVDALRRVPFRLNTNDFHFDTDIIIQLVFAGFRIKEVPIPTYYGDEICHVDGMKYAWDVFKSTLLARVQKLSLLYRRKYDVWPDDMDIDSEQARMEFDSVLTEAIAYIPSESRVLDIACGFGHVSGKLREKGCTTTGLDRKAVGRSSNFDRFIEHDPEDHQLPVALSNFDYVLLIDVVEHLKDPEDFLSELYDRANEADDELKIVITTGNVAFIVVRMMLFLGQFNYGRKGILDLKYSRLFTFRSLRILLQETGFRVIEERGIPAPFPTITGDSRLSIFLLKLNRILIRLARGLFSYQIFLVVEAAPSIDNLLDTAWHKSAERAIAERADWERAG
jgi:glycosyltransferase involved in cell wall biosynthesis/SAM-dependent methyltransferase